MVIRILLLVLIALYAFYQYQQGGIEAAAWAVGYALIGVVVLAVAVPVFLVLIYALFTDKNLR